MRLLFDPNRRDFFLSEGKKLKNLGVFGDIFQTQTKDGGTDLIQVKSFLTQTHR